MRTIASLVFALALAAAVAGSTMAQNQPPQANGEFKTAVGESVGNITLTQMPDGTVALSVAVRGLPPGEHGIHIHMVGACSPTFDAAGAHYNPEGRQHGLQNPNGPHAGDLPGLTVNGDGTGTLDAITNRVTIAPGATTIFDADGSAMIIHAFVDDQQTDPTGNSGGRIACAVLQPVVAAQPAPPAGGGTTPAQLPNTGADSTPWLALSLAALALICAGALALRRAKTKIGGF